MKVIFAAFVLFAILSPANAADQEMKIGVTIVQCGYPEDLKESCEKDERCCRIAESTDQDYDTDIIVIDGKEYPVKTEVME